ncbi:permease [Clostridium sp. D2Q-11]|uniref:Permease n=1 Tax=Anaeromonas frigoriresistens TaxID=2683708 RepID=A0A942UT40_9FIRM|nr:permease [Anaeromonas frigoriresistens]MBS4537465.1 permease [Anaeromonas frigoriresistens]
MDIFSIIFLIISIIGLLISFIKDKDKTLKSMKKNMKMMKNMFGSIFGVLLLIGLILAIIPPDMIKKIMGESNIYLSTIFSTIVGSITLIPAFVAFPLAGSLIDAGANIAPIAGFLTTLTMVGVVTFPIEKERFGFKFSIQRNLLSFGFAIIISIVMGVII